MYRVENNASYSLGSEFKLWINGKLKIDKPQPSEEELESLIIKENDLIKIQTTCSNKNGYPPDITVCYTDGTYDYVSGNKTYSIETIFCEFVVPYNYSYNNESYITIDIYNDYGSDGCLDVQVIFQK